MPESPDDLLRRIRLGEDHALELKEVVFAGRKIRDPSRNALADEMAAFANARGGALVLGVSGRTRDVTGIPLDRLDAVQDMVLEAMEEATDPPIDAAIRRMELPGPDGAPRRVLHLDVGPGLDIHRSPSGYLRRVNGANFTMTPGQLARLAQHRLRSLVIRFDDRVEVRAKADDLDASLVERFRTPRTRGDWRTLARKMGMLGTDPSGAMRPTIAGLLMGSRRPDRWLRNAYIQAVRYSGRDLAESWSLPHRDLDAEDIHGPLDAQVIGACRFVFRNQAIAASKSVGRLDIPQYDMTSVFEALVNAVAHRDYSIHGSHIRLRMFSSRLEIYAPGELPDSMELDLLAEQQSTRNETIANLLRGVPVPHHQPWGVTPRSTFMNGRGEGVPMILDRSEAHSGRKPEYRMLGDSELLLTIFAAGPDESGYTGGTDDGVD